MGQPAKQESGVKKFPICLVALSDSKLGTTLAHDLIQHGMQVQIVNSLKDYLAASENPAVFSFFVDITAHNWAIKLLKEKKFTPRELWAGVGPKLNTSQHSQMFNLGFADVLTLPLHPVTVRSRARLFLGRYVRTHGMPEEISLPAGVKRPTGVLKKPQPVTSNTKPAPKAAGRGARLLKVRNEFGNHKVLPEKIPVFETAVLDLSGPQKDLFQALSQQKRNSVIKEFGEKNANPVIWIKNQKWKSHFVTETLNISEGLLRLKFPPGVSKASVTQALAAHEIEEVYVSVPLRRGRAFFATPKGTLKIDNLGITLKIPDNIFQTQRRRDFRLILNPIRGFPVHLKPQSTKPRMTFTACNISAGGCQLVLSEHQASLFKRNQTCPEIDFLIFDKKIPCAGIVRWKRSTPKDKATERDAYRIGIEFYQMSESDQEGVQLFVLEESFGYLKSFIST